MSSPTNQDSGQPSDSHNAIREQVFSRAAGLEVTDALFRSLPNVLFCVKDRQRRYVAANESLIAATLKGSLSEVIGRTASHLFPSLLAAGYEQQDDEVFQRGRAIEDRLEMITRSNGEFGWYVSHKVPIRTASGEVIALAGVSRDLETRASGTGALGVFKTAIDTLYADYAKPLKIGELASNSQLSWSQFQRRFTQITGLAPRQLLTKIRLEAATRQLVESNDSISKIALDCGFYDQAALSRKFKEVTGLSPIAYRKAMQEVNSSAS